MAVFCRSDAGIVTEPTLEARAETKLALAMPCKEEEAEGNETGSMRQRETKR